MWYVRFKQAVAILLLPWLLAVIAQSAGRLFLLLSYVTSQTMANYQDDIAKLFTVGLRFDIRTASILIAPLLAITLLTLFSAKFTPLWQRCLGYLGGVVATLATIFTVINIFYYITYDRHIDVFIFGLIDDDTQAIIETIWADYPVVWGLVGFVAMALLFFSLIQRWRRWIVRRVARPRSLFMAVPVMLTLIGVVVVGCRGSIGTFPLREADAQISRSAVINMFVPNGLMAMQWAYKNYQHNQQLTPIDPAERAAAMRAFWGQEKPNSVSVFMHKTAPNVAAERTPPHVVLAVMESMGSHLFEFDNPSRDLYGNLRQHWQQDWLFSRFVSEGDGTIDSLNRFFVRSPMDKVSQSSAQNVNYLSNMFAPYKAQGYKVIYITAGNGAWRNLNQFLPHLGVDEFIEQSTLLHEFPEAEVTTWGVPDEYMFKYAERRLAEADKQNEHLMIMMMSITNHPPYTEPRTHRTQPYSFRADELERLKNMGDEDEIRSMFNTFRYSNNALGNFISWVKAAPLAEHTLIAVTGDHNIRGIGYPDPAELALSHSVPFYLYVPKAYQLNAVYDSRRVGSHKDIMPTLYALSLSEAPYYQTGCDLLAVTLDPLWCNAGYNPHVLITNEGAYSLERGTFQPWQAAIGLRLAESQSTLAPAHAKTLNRWQSWTTLLQWQLNQQIFNSERQ